MESGHFSADQDPLRRRAPDEFWQLLYKLVNRGEEVDFMKMDESKVHLATCQVEMNILAISVSSSPEEYKLTAIPLAAWIEPILA